MIFGPWSRSFWSFGHRAGSGSPVEAALRFIRTDFRELISVGNTSFRNQLLNQANFAGKIGHFRPLDCLITHHGVLFLALNPLLWAPGTLVQMEPLWGPLGGPSNSKPSLRVSIWDKTWHGNYPHMFGWNEPQ